LAETVKRKANEMAALIEEINGISDCFSAFEKDKKPAPESRVEVLAKTSQPLKAVPGLFSSPWREL
jgi:hypothetical protein